MCDTCWRRDYGGELPGPEAIEVAKTIRAMEDEGEGLALHAIVDDMNVKNRFLKDMAAYGELTPLEKICFSALKSLKTRQRAAAIMQADGFFDEYPDGVMPPLPQALQSAGSFVRERP